MDLAFLNPAGFGWLALVPLLVIPWLLRERVPRLVVPAAFLFRDLQGARRPRRGRRFRPDVSFFLKLLILLFAILALAAPILSTPRDRAALVIDDSASLLARADGERTRFDVALAEARTLVGEETAGLWDLYRLTPSPHPILRDASPGAVLDRLDEIRPTNLADPAAPELAGFLRRLADGGYSTIYVVTDRPTAGGSGSFRVVTVGEPMDNVGITAASMRRDEGLFVEATVESFSREPFQGSLVVESGGEPPSADGEAIEAIMLEPGGRVTRALPVPAEGDARLVLHPGGSFSADDVVELPRRTASLRSVLVVTPLERTGLEHAGTRQGFRVERLAPEEYRPGAARDHDVVVFHRTAPTEEPQAPSLYVMPPPTAFLPGPVGTVTRSTPGLDRATHPALRYLERGALEPERAIVFDSRDDGWEALLTGTDGPLLLVRDSSAVVGFDLLPFRPDVDRATAILTLNLLTWLLDDGTPEVSGVLSASESNLLAPATLSLPDEAAAARPGQQRVPLDRILLALAVIVVVGEILLYGRRTGANRLVLGTLWILLVTCLVGAIFAGRDASPGPTMLLDVSESVLGDDGAPPDPPPSGGPFGRTLAFASRPVSTGLPPDPAVVEASGPTATDLEAALLETIARDANVLLVTDGWETHGDATRILPLLRESTTRIFPVPVTGGVIENVAVERVGVTPLPTGGGAVRVEAFLRNDGPTAVAGTLRFDVDDELRATRSLTLPAGRRLVAEHLTVPGGGLREIAVRFEADDPERNTVAADDVARAWTGTGESRRVLVVSGAPASDRYLVPVLQAGGFTVRTVTPADAVGVSPEDHDTVVLNDVSRDRLPGDWPERLRRFTDAGGGLVMIGGPQSFGPGGYRDTPIETALPVLMKPREREQPRLATALVIDKSGSMRRERRLAFAVESARRLLDRLEDDDRLTVIAFDRRPFVIVPLREVADLRGRFESQIARLAPSGGTRLYPALEEARRELLGQQARRRHVIVLSDGLSEDSETAAGRRRYYDLVLAMANQGVTISTIALGEGADGRFLERLAGLGRGVFHATTDPASLPELIVGEVGERGREQTIVETTVRSVPDPDSPVIGETARSAPPWPPVLGLVETELRREARVDVSARTRNDPPLVASWQYGRGRSVAVTTDATGRWSDRWVRWDGWSSFWVKLVDWTSGVSEGRRLGVEMSYEGGVLEIRLARFDRDVPGPVPLEVALAGGGRSSLEARRTAPGHYQASLSTEEPGTYEVTVGSSPDAPTVAWTIPEEARREQRRPTANRSLLDRIARETGGRVLDPAEPFPSPLRDATLPFADLLIVLALAALLAETFVRRLHFAFRSLRILPDS